METILEVRNLRKMFADGKEKRVVLDGVSFSVKEGEILGIVGGSGCGKSTAARIVARLLPSDGGEVLLCGKDITRAEGKELFGVYEKMQMIFQLPEDSFDPRQTLGWSIGEAMRNHGWERAHILRRINSLLNQVGLRPSYQDRYPHEVSGGECQRAAIARAVALSPKLLICDEATSALDVTVQAQTVKLLRKLCKEQKMACIFITHDLAILPKISDRVIVMQEGRIVEEGTPEGLFRNAKSLAARELIEADFFRMTADRE